MESKENKTVPTKSEIAMDILKNPESRESNAKLKTATKNGKTFEYGNSLERRLTEAVLSTSLEEAKKELQSEERAVEITKDPFTGMPVINVMSDKVVMRSESGKILRIVDNLEDIKLRAKLAAKKKNSGIENEKGNAGAYNPAIEQDIEFE